MIVSWQWLGEYVSVDAPLDEVLSALTMAGLKIESQKAVGEDRAIDVEVTSNRPDCLGHLGVAREVAVLFGGKLSVPEVKPKTSGEKTASVTSVAIECADLCPQYFARVIKGGKVG